MDITTTSMIRSAIDAVLLGRTPRERWAATRQLNTTNMSEHTGEGILIAAVVVLVFLAALLWWIARVRKRRNEQTGLESFGDDADLRQLSTREHQILSAIAARSGLKQSDDTFTAADAFDQGAAKLQEECSRTRTAEESESLRAEVISLRRKLGFERERPQDGSFVARGSTARSASTRTVAVRIPALTARLPAMRAAASPRVGGREQVGSAKDSLELEPPSFVSGVVTEIAGAALRMEIPIQISVGDRVLVMFRIGGASKAENAKSRVNGNGYTVSDIGHVRDARKANGGFSINVELTGLSNAEEDNLIRLARAAQSRGNADSPGPVPVSSVAAEGTT